MNCNLQNAQIFLAFRQNVIEKLNQSENRLHWVQHDMTVTSWQGLPSESVLLTSSKSKNNNWSMKSARKLYEALVTINSKEKKA